MSVWNHIGPRNLIHLQQMAAIAHIDRQIAQDHAAGYGHDVDELLERRKALLDSLTEGRPVA